MLPENRLDLLGVRRTLVAMENMVNMGRAATPRRPLGALLIIIAGLLGGFALANPPSTKGDPESGRAHDKAKAVFSNTILVKLKPGARLKLKVVGEEVNPSATGLASVDAICRDFGVKEFRSIVLSTGVHRDPSAPINSWYKITLAGVEQRITLREQTNDDALNLLYSGAE